MKRFTAHGKYKLWLENQVIVLAAAGGWNKEAAQELFESISQLLPALNGNKFAKLVDARQWELGTPDFQYLTESALQELVEQGLTREVFIVQKGSLKKDQLKLITPTDSRYQRTFVETPEQAINWLKEQGFNCVLDNSMQSHLCLAE